MNSMTNSPCIFFLLFLLLSGQTCVQAQLYDDYYGAGHQSGMSISSSDSNSGLDAPVGIVNGANNFPDLIAASRFLGQATMGASMEDIEYLHAIGIDAWLDEQFAMELPNTYEISLDIHATYIAEISASQNADLPIYFSNQFARYAFWQKVVEDDDQLRQRVALALSEIFVVSQNSLDDPFAVSSYYSILSDNAFGNYRDMLYDITLQPAMAIYLSYFGNPKTDTIANIRPDENYAREIMQLFTIGLYEMNMDGSYKYDSDGSLIPTYDNDDIVEMAKIFTGLHPSKWNIRHYTGLDNENFQIGSEPYLYNQEEPMAMYEDLHEPGEKYLLNGLVVPEGQTGLEDINMALDMLFEHPNAAPFFCKRMIQFLIKSNPTPAFINRISQVFVDNGEGVRGDLQAVVRAILKDPEARECYWQMDAFGGKMREPILRFSHLIRAFDVYNNSGRYWHTDHRDWYELEQAYMSSPSVFNFFPADYQPSGIIADNGLVAPEFKIHNSRTAINNLNVIESRFSYQLMDVRATIEPHPEDSDEFAWVSMGDDDLCRLNLSDEIEILQNEGAAALIDRMNLLLCHGQLSLESSDAIADAIQQYSGEDYLDDENLIESAIYFMMAAPDYNIIK